MTRRHVTTLVLLGCLAILAIALIQLETHHSNPVHHRPVPVHHLQPTPRTNPNNNYTPPTTTSPTTEAPTVPSSTTTTVETQPPSSGTAVTSPPAGTTYLPVAQGSPAGCSAGITEGNQWIKYTIKPGDNLYDIAKCFGLNGYETLYQDNETTLGANPDLIYPGAVITIVNGVMSVTEP